MRSVRQAAELWRFYAATQGGRRTASVAPLCKPDALQIYNQRLIEAVVSVTTASPPLGHGRSGLKKRCGLVALVFLESVCAEAGLHVNLAIVEFWLPRDVGVRIEHLVRGTLLAQGGRWSKSNRRLPCDALGLPEWVRESIMWVDPTHLREYLSSHENADGLFDESARPERASTFHDVSKQTAGQQLEQKLIDHFASSGADDAAIATLATKCAVFSLTDLAVSRVAPHTHRSARARRLPHIGEHLYPATHRSACS